MDTALCTKVHDYIETVRPAGGVAVTVVPAEAVTITISCTVVIDESTTIDAVKTALQTAVNTYLKGLAMTNASVLYNRISYFLLGIEGVTDFSGLTVNGSAANIPVTETQTPTLGTITLGV